MREWVSAIERDDAAMNSIRLRCKFVPLLFRIQLLLDHFYSSYFALFFRCVHLVANVCDTVRFVEERMKETYIYCYCYYQRSQIECWIFVVDPLISDFCLISRLLIGLLVWDFNLISFEDCLNVSVNASADFIIATSQTNAVVILFYFFLSSHSSLEWPFSSTERR